MFNFATLFGIAEEVVAEAPAVISEAQAGYAKIKTLLADPSVIALEAEAAKLFHLTTTPGAAVVVQPKK